jgi:hypothetical protein
MDCGSPTEDSLTGMRAMGAIDVQLPTTDGRELTLSRYT